MLNLTKNLLVALVLTFSSLSATAQSVVTPTDSKDVITAVATDVATEAAVDDEVNSAIPGFFRTFYVRYDALCFLRRVRCDGYCARMFFDNYRCLWVVEYY